MVCDLVCLLVGSQTRIDMPLGGHERRGKCAVERSWRKGRDARRLDCSIEHLMKGAELLVVRSVTGLVDIKQRDDQARLLGLAADAGRRLDIFGGSLGL